MGILHKVNQKLKAEEKKKKAYQLSKALQEFYESHLISQWQQGEINKIRKDYEEKQKALNIAHDIASSQLSEQFMQFELDYLYSSDEFKKDNPGINGSVRGIKNIFKKEFWGNLKTRLKNLTSSIEPNGERAEN